MLMSGWSLGPRNKITGQSCASGYLQLWLTRLFPPPTPRRNSTTGKPTFFGCGMHVENPGVLGNIPKDQRCQCDRNMFMKIFTTKARGIGDRGKSGRRLTR